MFGIQTPRCGDTTTHPEHPLHGGPQMCAGCPQDLSDLHAMAVAVAELKSSLELHGDVMLYSRYLPRDHPGFKPVIEMHPRVHNLLMRSIDYWSIKPGEQSPLGGRIDKFIDIPVKIDPQVEGWRIIYAQGTVGGG